MNNTGRPWHLWLIGILSLLWNSYGGYDYYMTQAENAEYLRPMTEPYGVAVEDALAYFASYPIWLEVLWALGVWTSVAGAVLMLLRSKFAYYAFIISLIGLIGAFGWSTANPQPGLTDTPVAYGMTGLVCVLIILQIIYCRRMTQRGVLR